MQQAPGHPRRLFRKYAAVLMGLVGVLLLASAGVQTFFAYRQTRQDLGRIQIGEAEVAAVRIEQFIAGVLPSLKAANRASRTTTGSVTPETRRDEYNRVLTVVDAITDLRYVDGDGKEQLFVSRLTPTAAGSGVDFSRDPALQLARPDHPYFGPVTFRDGSEPYMRIAVAAARPDDGVTIADINLKVIPDVIAPIVLGHNGAAYVADADGNLVAHTDISFVLKRSEVSSLAQVRAARAMPAVPNQPRTGSTSARDLRGGQVLSAYATIEPPGWLVFVERPLGDAYRPLYAVLWESGALLLIGLGLAALASLALARRMLRPIHLLQAGAVRIGAGDLDQRLALHTGDELEALADEFNRMARQLRESYTGLEAQVTARTAELTGALAQLETKSRQLETAGQAKSEFLSRMSHELRTPLNAIIGFTEVLQMDPATPPRQLEALRYIHGGGRQLLDLVNEVLDIARIEAGRLALSPEPIAVIPLFHELLDLIAPIAAGRDVTVRLAEMPDGSFHVRADRQRLRQILLNLLTNAVKYNRPGGSVVLGCSPASDEMLRLSVRDTGPGIPAEKLDRLFTPFDRLDAEQSGVEGTGLGLAIARRLSEAMGGTVVAESAVEEGSTFWLALPRVAEPAASVMMEPAEPCEMAVEATGPSQTVVCIEDNPSNLELVERIIAFRPRTRLLTASHGHAGLELVRHERPDLVLLDRHLPDLSGETVLRRLQDDPHTRAIPVVIVSADATPSQIERLIAAGAYAYLTKPVAVHELLGLLDKLARVECIA